MDRPDHEREGTAALLSDIVTGFGRLVRGEFLLAKAEASEGLKTAAGGLARIVIAAIVALVGFNVLAGAAVAALAATGLGTTWAAVIVGAALMALAAALAMAGRAALRLQGLWPDRALRGLRRDAEAVQAGLTE
jgi:hypothetical protein